LPGFYEPATENAMVLQPMITSTDYSDSTDGKAESKKKKAKRKKTRAHRCLLLVAVCLLF
jgi:hypothetical protein